MNVIQNYRFQTNVSVDTYKDKKEATACLSRAGAKAVGKNKMAFVEQSVSVAEFLNLATNGHAFCNLFDFNPDEKCWITATNGLSYPCYPVYKKGANKGAMKLTIKADQFFRGSQTVFVDIDFTKYTVIPEYISTLTQPPTCVYMSFSDNKDKHGIVSRRFRLVYVLDEIVGLEDFRKISATISDRIVLDTGEPMDDDCGTRVSQYMNGVFGNNETYRTDRIYSVSDFIGEGIDYIDNPQPQDEVEQETTQIVFNEQMVNDMVKLEYADFMHYYSKQYKYYYRTERPEIEEWINGLYQLTDDNYLQLWYYRERQIDGMMRRRKLFKNACLRRLMRPNVDPDTLLFNLYVDCFRFFDNSDGVITLDTLKRKVVNAIKITNEQLLAYCNWEIQYWQENRPKFICYPGIITTRGQLRTIAKTIRWAEIDKVYDRSKSIGENAETIDVPISTLYRYCNDKWINTNPNRGMTKEEQRKAKHEDKSRKIQLFKKLYDPDLTLRENMEKMEENGLELTKSTLDRWIEKYYELVPKSIFAADFTVPDFMAQFSSREEDAVIKTTVSDWDRPEASTFLHQLSEFGHGIPVPEFDWSKWGMV